EVVNSTPEIVSKRDLTARLGVKPSAISNYIARGKLTAPGPALGWLGRCRSGDRAITRPARSGAAGRARQPGCRDPGRAERPRRFSAAHLDARQGGLGRRCGRTGAAQ